MLLLWRGVLIQLEFLIGKDNWGSVTKSIEIWGLILNLMKGSKNLIWKPETELPDPVFYWWLAFELLVRFCFGRHKLVGIWSSLVSLELLFVAWICRSTGVVSMKLQMRTNHFPTGRNSTVCGFFLITSRLIEPVSTPLLVTADGFAYLPPRNCLFCLC
jgi:hypothetical protein